MKVDIEREIQQSAEDAGGKIRELLALRKVFAVSLISSPGSGKTTLIEQAIGALRGRKRIAVIEGDEKPLKYPLVFKTSDMLVITKTDMLPCVTFDPERVKTAARAVNPRVEIFEVSAVTGSGLPALFDRIEALCDRKIG